MKVLVLADSRDLVETISVILRVRWPDLSTLQAIEAREGMELIYREQLDIVMLHLDSATTVDCFDFISQIRSFSDVPIVILSQGSDVTDEVRALEMGADDWIVLSCIPMEFIGKLNGIVRRGAARNNNHGSSYHFKAVIVGEGISYGADRSFTTQGFWWRQ